MFSGYFRGPKNPWDDHETGFSSCNDFLKVPFFFFLSWFSICLYLFFLHLGFMDSRFYGDAV